MIKAVIDTNVLVSAFWTPNRLSPTVRIADASTKDLFVRNPKQASQHLGSAVAARNLIQSDCNKKAALG